jgi:hypothetical protein
VSMVSVRAGAEGARVGVSGLGLPAVVYGLCEGWCRSCRSCCKLGEGYLWLFMVSVKAGVKAAGVGLVGEGYLWLSMVSVKAGVEAAGVDVCWVTGYL